MKAFDLDSVYVQDCSISEGRNVHFYVWWGLFVHIRGVCSQNLKVCWLQLSRMGGVLVAVQRPPLKDRLPPFLWLETCSLSSAQLFSLSGSCSAIFFDWKPAQLFHQDSGLMQCHTQMASCNPLHIFDVFWSSVEKEKIYSSDLPVAAVCNMKKSMQYALQDTDWSTGKTAVIHLSTKFEIHITFVSSLWLQFRFGLSSSLSSFGLLWFFSLVAVSFWFFFYSYSFFGWRDPYHFGCSFFLVFLLCLVSLVSKIHITLVSVSFGFFSYA